MGSVAGVGGSAGACLWGSGSASGCGLGCVGGGGVEGGAGGGGGGGAEGGGGIVACPTAAVALAAARSALRLSDAAMHLLISSTLRAPGPSTTLRR